MPRAEGVLVVGSIAQDFVESPVARLEGELGGSVPYFALAARHLAAVSVVGSVGVDRADEVRQVLDFADNSRLSVTEGPTYTWRARRDTADGDATTLERFAGGYAGYQPQLDPVDDLPATIFLGSSDPDIQLAVARAAPGAALIAGDTMDIFIQRQRQRVEEMVRRCQVLFGTEHELELLSRTRGTAAAAETALYDYGVEVVVVKRGKGGAVLWTPTLHQRFQAFPVDAVDPTGAGDALAGGMMARLAEIRAVAAVAAGADGPLVGLSDANLVDALEWGMVAASFAIEAPGLAGIRAASRADLEARLVEYRRPVVRPG